MKTTDRPKPRLSPVDVPWQVSPTTPYLRLRVSESDDDQPTEVSFVGYYGPVALPNWEPGQPQQSAAGPSSYHLRVIFEQGRWARFSPALLDADPIDESRYDVQALRLDDDRSRPVHERVKAGWDAWRRTGRCPDPNMYAVTESEWLRDLGGPAHGLVHFIIVGHDSFIEVVAKGWRVESDGLETYRQAERDSSI